MQHTRIHARTDGAMAHPVRSETSSRRRRIGAGLAAGLLLLSLGASTAFAKGGSVYATSGCDYPSLQDNTIDQGADLYVWIKFTGNTVGVAYTWTTVDNGGANLQEGYLEYTGCTRDDGKYILYLADGFDSSVLGSYTLTAWNGSKAISGDGFRVEAAEA